MEKGTATRQNADKATSQHPAQPAHALQPAVNPWYRLQQSIGNQAVVRMFSSPDTVRRSCACGGSGSGAAMCATCEEEDRLRRSSKDRSGEGELAPQIVRDVLRSPGQPLADGTRSFMESRFGRDFRPIRVSSDDSSAKAADAIRAKAFSFGNRIVFGRGEYAPDSPSGLRLLAHELAHTAQQGSGAPSVQASLRIGGVDDPQEREADLAADTVLTDARAPALSSGASAVRRQPKGYKWEPKGANEATYTSADGVKYTVIRKYKPVTKSEPTKVTPGFKFAKAFVTISYCRERTRATAEVGVDITNQIQQLIPQMLSTGNPAQVLRQAKLTPYVQLVVIQSEKGLVAFDIQADVSLKGVSAVRGGLSVDTRYGKFEAKGGVDLPQGGRRANPTATLVYTPPADELKKVDCDHVKLEETYECRIEKVIPPSDVPVPHQKLAPPRTHYIYFDYATDIVTSSRTAYGKKHPEVVARNQDTFRKIRDDLGEGFRVIAIEGYTSPEGPMDPKGKFEGNANLSKERAVAAHKFISDEVCMLRRDEACFAGGKDKITPVGCGELYTVITGGTETPEPPGCSGQAKLTTGGTEAEGKKLAEFAVPEFLKTEGSDLTEKEREALAQKRGALAQSEVVYPLLRRAKITLSGGMMEVQEIEHHPGKVETTTVECPEEVITAAKLGFSLSDLAKSQSP